MKLNSVCLYLVAGVLLSGTATATAATVGGSAVGYALGNNGRTLVRIDDLSMPGIAAGTALTDGAGNSVPLSALAYRPRTREFFGYSDRNDTVYRVNVGSGVATSVASLPGATNVSSVGFDFNNQIDAARIVSTAEDNLVFFPNNTPPNIARFTNLFYGPGDLNAGADPSVFGNAYTNAVAFPSSTLQYVLDSDLDTLATLANNAGTLTTVGKLSVGGVPLDFTDTGGFDILSLVEGDNTAFALLTTVMGQGLYKLSLTADAAGFVDATFLGSTSAGFGPLDGFAVAPIPVPASLGLLVAALAGLGIVGKGRRRSGRPAAG